MSKHRDPVTGDELTTGEYVSWLIQGVIRRWTFLIIVTVGTVVCWATRNPDVLLWWNLVASFLAIVIESIVGLAMFGQTKRDALAIRQIREISRRLEEVASVILRDVEHLEEEVGGPEDGTSDDLLLHTPYSSGGRYSHRGSPQYMDAPWGNESLPPGSSRAVEEDLPRV